MLALLSLLSPAHADDDEPTGAVVTLPEEEITEVNIKRSPEGWGVGVAVGAGTLEASVAYRESTTWALQFGLGYLTSGTASADFLYNFVVAGADDAQNRFALYAGVGARIIIWDRVGIWRDRGYENNGLGVRLPIGIALLPRDVAFDVFLQGAPVLIFAPGVGPAYDATLGARYFF